MRMDYCSTGIVLIKQEGKMTTSDLQFIDPELYECLRAEENHQATELEMVASESIQPREALFLAGSAFNNKTAVGPIGNQRLEGSQFADQLERMAARRACEVFGAEHANMTTYSGSVANFCAYEAVLVPGDAVLALDPSTGSHQSHGGKGNVSSRTYRFSYFGLKEDTLEVDYEGAEQIAKQVHPKLIVIGSAAYPRNFNFPRLAQIAHDNGALLMVDIAHFSGLIAAGISPNPVPDADIVTASTTKTMCGPHSGFIMCKEAYAKQVEASIYPGHVASLHLQTIAAMTYALKRSQTEEFRALMRQVVRNASYLSEVLQRKGFAVFTGGTDCHMFLLDVRPFGLDGAMFSKALSRAGISVNSKKLPFEEGSLPGGIRLGTTVLTQRGMKEAQMEEVAQLLYRMAKEKCSDEVIEKVRERVKELSMEWPIVG